MCQHAGKVDAAEGRVYVVGLKEKRLAHGEVLGAPFSDPRPLPLPGSGDRNGVKYQPPKETRGGAAYMTQNDPHVELIISSVHLLGKFFGEKILLAPL